MDPRVIGLTGPFGSGCSTIAAILEQMWGYKTIRISRFIEQIASDPGITVPEDLNRRRALQIKGNMIRCKSRRNDILVSELGDILMDKDRKIAIDCLKNKDEILWLRNLLGDDFLLISVFSSEGDRFDRESVQRAYQGNKYDFMRDDLRDRDEFGTDAPWGQQVLDCEKEADILVENNNFDTPEKWTAYLSSEITPYVEGDSLMFDEDVGSMWVAEAVGSGSKCLKRKVGASIVKDGRIISIGYNRTPAGIKECKDEHEVCYREYLKGQIEKELPEEINKQLEEAIVVSDEERMLIELIEDPLFKSRYAKQISKSSSDYFGYYYDFKTLEACRALHAEEVAIITALRRGEELEGSHLYCTTYPCLGCAKKITEVGIKHVHYIEPYPMNEVSKFFHEKDVTQVRYSGVRAGARDHFYDRESADKQITELVEQLSGKEVGEVVFSLSRMR